MKRFIFVLTAVLSLTFLLLPVNVYALQNDCEYRRIITKDTPFYSNSNGTNLLFYLPYTYYVKVLEQGKIFSHVEIYGENYIPVIDGYTLTDKLFDDGLSVIDPYPTITLTTLNTAVLYSDINLTKSECYVFPERSMHYLGFVVDDKGKYCYYVLYNNRLGYISEENVLPFTLPNHPNELTFMQTEKPNTEPNPSTTPKAENFFSLKIAVVVCLAFAGVIALFIILKKKEKPSVAISYYDENDYE